MLSSKKSEKINRPDGRQAGGKIRFMTVLIGVFFSFSVFAGGELSDRCQSILRKSVALPEKWIRRWMENRNAEENRKAGVEAARELGFSTIDMEEEDRPQYVERISGRKYKGLVPSKHWTRFDHNPENKQSVHSGFILFFIDGGHVFATDAAHPGWEGYMGGFAHIGGLSKITQIVEFEGDLVALTEGKKVYRYRGKQDKWVKIGKDAEHISVSELPDGSEVLHMTDRLDPLTGKPL